MGKPNPLMMRTGLKLLGVHSEDAAIIGDRMDTDIVAGIESGLDTVLVLSGVTTRESMLEFPYRPRLILDGVGDIPAAAQMLQLKRTNLSQLWEDIFRPFFHIVFTKSSHFPCVMVNFRI